MAYIVVKPSGVVLHSQAKILWHYHENKDFFILSFFLGFGRHINKADCEHYNVEKLEVRYGDRDQKALIINVKKEMEKNG